MDRVELIENTEEAIKEFHKLGWASQDLVITREQLNEFIKGKLIAINDGEYTHTIKLID